jgi:hypothetical protein
MATSPPHQNNAEQQKLYRSRTRSTRSTEITGSWMDLEEVEEVEEVGGGESIGGSWSVVGGV